MDLLLTNKSLVNDRITVSSPFEIYLPSVVSNQTLQTKKIKYEILTNFQKPTILIRLNLLQVCPSMPTFVFAVKLIPSYNVFSDSFYVSPNFEMGLTVTVLINHFKQLHRQPHDQLITTTK